MIAYGKLTVVPEEAEVVRRIYNNFLAGNSHMKTVKELPQYLVQDDHEAIIDMDTFERVQEQLARNKEIGRFPYNHNGEKNPFTAKVVCGRHYTRQLWNTSEVGRKRPSWVCTGKKTDRFQRSFWNGNEKWDVPQAQQHPYLFYQNPVCRL